jgi:hypothetical protein
MINDPTHRSAFTLPVDLQPRHPVARSNTVWRHGAVALCLAALALPGLAAPGDHRGEGREFQRDGNNARALEARGQWWDGAHGHGHAYPVPGRHFNVLPQHSRVVFYGGVRYGFYDGIWYSPGPSGYLVVRPPFGVVVSDLPAFATVLTIGAVGYWYANGIYYRGLPGGGGYEVVAPPVSATVATPVNEKLYIYPRNGQPADKQASDEYECHRWAVTQSGFDPTANATSSNTAPVDVSKRGDYGRAQAACLDGRGYTVK